MELHDWDVDFGSGKGTADFLTDDDLYMVRVDFELDFDTHCEWVYFGGRDIEECTPVALLFNYSAVTMCYTPEGWEVGEDAELSREDEQELQYLIDDEYVKYLEEQEEY